MCKKCGKHLVAALALIAGSGSALNAAEFTPPEGCEPFLTVQSESCVVNIMWQCDMGLPGDKWDAYFDADGMQSVVSYSNQYAWLTADYMWDNSTEEATGTPSDPISLAMLVLNGVDTYDFQMRRTDASGTRILNVTGADTLMNEQVTIDGQVLERLSYTLRITEEDGTPFYVSSGYQLLMPDLRVFLSDVDEVTEDGQVTTYSDRPVDFIFPGEPGFADTTPLYGCNAAEEEASSPGPDQDSAAPFEPGRGKNSDK